MPFAQDPVGSVLGDRDKRRAAAQLLGQAYVTAYALIASNREAVERIADALVERKEMHGDEVIDLLEQRRAPAAPDRPPGRPHMAEGLRQTRRQLVSAVDDARRRTDVARTRAA